MDKTYMSNTVRTADDTRFVRYPPTYDESLYSRGMNGQPRNGLISPASSFQQLPRESQIYVYCPVCRRDFVNSDIMGHARVHDISHAYNYRIQESKSLNNTTDSIYSSTASMYPLIEPLQFWTNQLNDPIKHDNFILNSNEAEVDNRSGVDHMSAVDHMNAVNAVSTADHMNTVSTVNAEAQTVNRPPLQYESNETNLYNCLDNMVNPGKGPKFTMADIFSHNQTVTPKRHLNEWQEMTINENKAKQSQKTKKKRN